MRTSITGVVPVLDVTWVGEVHDHTWTKVRCFRQVSHHSSEGFVVCGLNLIKLHGRTAWQP
jgi:hypothetical protein